MSKLESANTQHEERFRAAVDTIADQLRMAVDGRFDFRINVGATDATALKLQTLINRVLDSAGRAMAESASKSAALEAELVERLRAQEMLAASETQSRAIVGNAPDGMVTINQDGIVESFNLAAEKIFGFAADEIIGGTVNDLMPSPHREEHDRHLRKYSETGVQTIIGTRREIVGRRKDGSTFPMEIHVSEVPRPSGGAFTAIVRDVTQRQRMERSLLAHRSKLESVNAQLAIDRQCLEAEQERIVSINANLVEARRAAESANKAKSDFLANVSHEIRTPMTAIIGFSENLLDANLPEHERMESVQTIRRNGEYLLAIINDILDLSKIEADKMNMENVECRPWKLIEEVSALVRVRADAKGLSFDVEHDGPIPETIQTDPTRVRQVLINLIGNAVKFTAAGGVRLIVRLIPDDVNPRLMFDVIDTGCGMTANQVSCLFQPFSQADASTTRRFGGAGLGLSISQRFAEALGGEITVVSSREGEGSHFRAIVATGCLDGVRMLHDPTGEVSGAPEPAEAKPVTNKPPDLEGRRILLAEDGPDNQRLISFVLKKAGASVTVMENGKLAAEAALQARAEQQPFDVILMDMQMPVMDGYEATSLLRREGYGGPILALTAHAMSSDRQKCLDAGCDDYATKPIDRAKLVALIRRHSEVSAATSATPTGTHWVGRGIL